MKPVTCGDARTIAFTTYDENNAIVDISGARIFMTVRSPFSHVVAFTKDSNVSSSQAQVVNGPLGQGACFLVAADSADIPPGEYPFAIKVVLPDGSPYTGTADSETIPFRRNKSAI